MSSSSPLGRSRPQACALVLAVVTAVLLAGCAVSGTPRREAMKDPIRCSASECPELPVFSSKRLAESGVTAANASTTVPAYLTAVLDDLESVWQEWFAELNIENAAAGRVLITPGTSYRSECLKDTELRSGIPSDYPNAFYCLLDSEPDGGGTARKGSVILPVTTFAEMWDGKLMGSSGILLGDFTAATIIAHEYGHNVMYRLLEAYSMDKREGPTGDAPELLADCFAGNWAATVFGRKDLSFKEMAQAAMLIISIGDPAPGQGHGTSLARAKALWKGFSDNLKRQGTPGDCLQAYWPAVLRSA
ncbi:neutral zinc metallopeptidase [Gordonia shandongensis]|uniref:neutral zinc metallopeptidase n=1 Tax=Gordonia shandongensis TaxID=376351 RepID=UPI000684C54B|nr:neutral zinc metallopeptidase [Gordonia shandongensis]